MRHWAVIALVGLIAGAALGCAVFVALVPGEVPASLASAGELDMVEPSTMEYDDAREVTITLTLETGSGVRSPRAGILTATSCVPGQAVASGSTPFAVDGASVVALSTATPLWRAIAVGDEGADVAALENELVRLGAAPEPDGHWSWADVRAFDSRLDPVITDDDGTVPFAAITWLPAPDVVVDSCPVALGSTIGVATLVATFAPRITLARFAPPVGAVDGARGLVFDGEEFAAPSTGEIVDRGALDTLAASPSFAQRDPAQDPPTITASSVLTVPIAVTVLPPSALYSLEGGSGCVQSREGAARVSVIASQLGRTLVTVARPLGQVRVHPDTSVPCP